MTETPTTEGRTPLFVPARRADAPRFTPGHLDHIATVRWLRRRLAEAVAVLLGRVDAPEALPVEPAVEPTPMVSLLTGSLVAMPGAPSLTAAT